MDGKKGLGLTPREISAPFADPIWAERYPPILSTEQAASLLQMPLATVYDWRSRGLLGRCSRRVGKRVLFFRDRLIDLVLNEGLLNADD